jgi:hypothetical protein
MPSIYGWASVFRSSVFAAAMISCCLLVGCNKGPKLVQLTGTVTINGQPPPKPGALQFNPIEAADGFDRHPAVGRFDTNGHYTTTTFSLGDGITPGKYSVGLECYEYPPDMDKPMPKNYAPNKWRTGASSGITVSISPDESSKQFDVKATD